MGGLAPRANSPRSPLLDEIEGMICETYSRIEDLQKEAQQILQSVDEAARTIDNLLQDDTELASGVHHVELWLKDVVENVPIVPTKKTVDEITEIVCDMRVYNNPATSDLLNSSSPVLTGYRKWELAETVKIPRHIQEPYIDGCIADDVIISDNCSWDLFSLNLKSNSLSKVLSSYGFEDICTCVVLDENTIVCSKYMEECVSDYLVGCICLFSRGWRLMKEISIPRNTSGDVTWVRVDVTNDGMIVAAEVKQPNVYIIDPSNGRIVDTITCEEVLWMRGLLSTGDIVAGIAGHLAIIDSHGSHKKIAKIKGKFNNAAIDRRTDSIYYLYWDNDLQMCIIDQLSSAGEVKTEGVLRFPLKTGYDDVSDSDLLLYINASRMILTSTGELVLCNGKECLTFKGVFSFSW